MMIRSKFITVVACIALMLTALTGCDGNISSADNASVSNEQVDARQKYVYYCSQCAQWEHK